MSLMKVAKNIPVLQASYITGHPMMLPVNITVSGSYRCNSRCKTCNVWLLPNDDFTIEEWDRTFQSLRQAPYLVYLQRWRAYPAQRLARDGGERVPALQAWHYQYPN